MRDCIIAKYKYIQGRRREVRIQKKSPSLSWCELVFGMENVLFQVNQICIDMT